jgi:hypothetical protein
MAFTALINRHVFTTRQFDSGALTVLASVIHQFTDPGHYIVSIRRGDTSLGSARFDVVANSTSMQVNIDLAAGGIPGKLSPFLRSARAAKAKSGGAGDCNCGGSSASAGGSGGGVGGGGAAVAAGAAATSHGAPPPAVVSPQGYVQFFVSHGEGGLYALVHKAGADTIAFDSRTLEAGDLFAVSLLAPAKFDLKNTAGTATGTVSVSFSKEVAAKIKTTPPVFCDVSKSAFTPKDLHLSSGQGLVFRITDAARVVITQQTDPNPQVRARGHAAARRIYRVPSSKPRQR